MKPAPFAYHAPGELEEALALLAEHGDEAKVLAGGQSLIPLLNFRLAAPARLIDITRIPALTPIEPRNGTLHIGATARQASLERSPSAGRWPVLVDAVRQVAHPQIRNAGTVGGSVAHADPAAELPAVFLALGSRFHAASLRGTRTVPSDQFFLGPFTTALEPDELLISIEVPEPPSGTGMAFVEFARRDGDFALGGAAVALQLDTEGICRHVAVSLLAGPAPWRSREAEAMLLSARVDDDVIDAAARIAVRDFEPTGDIHGSSDYRKSLGETMARRALQIAVRRSRQLSQHESRSTHSTN